MKQVFNNVSIIATGSYVPETVYTNEFLGTILPTDSDWIYKNLGIKERRIAAPNQTTSDLGAEAALRALRKVGVSADEIGLLVVATATPDRKAPSTAAFIQNKINAYNALCFDVAAVCSGFLYALSIAAQYVNRGDVKYALVIGADVFSRITDWTKREAVFFGDGAGAVMLSRCEDSNAYLAMELFTDSSHEMLGFTVPSGGTEIPLTKERLEAGEQYFKMNGRSVYNFAMKALPKAINAVLEDANLSVDDIDIVIPHQPSIKILKDTAAILKIPFSKVMTNMDKYANTSGATIPLLLDETNGRNILKSGDLILFAAVGSGWTYGAALLRWI